MAGPWRLDHGRVRVGSSPLGSFIFEEDEERQ